ncbi:CTP synthase [Purpureocillium lavendulum]|uniref:CTP synthase n=1 Tax=Purpureocillium lavendulum TaxID=1247861 RepID=A0AB34FZ92_9HYPO|nr:CTP synthase [Purpureocillium lavendulum]
MRFSYLSLIAAAASASPIQMQRQASEHGGNDLAARTPQGGVPPVVPLQGAGSVPKSSAPQPQGQNATQQKPPPAAASTTQKKPPPTTASAPNEPPPPENPADAAPPPVHGILNVNGIDFWLMLDNIAKGLHSFHDS